MPDRLKNTSRKDGYRLIYLVSKTEDRVAFLDIYAKRGPLQQLDIDDAEVITLTQIFRQEKENDTLEPYNL